MSNSTTTITKFFALHESAINPRSEVEAVVEVEGMEKEVIDTVISYHNCQVTTYQLPEGQFVTGDIFGYEKQVFTVAA